ncbi:MAG TPA: purine-nucleoside phosphorylase, partial [Bacteroidota bacterium]
EAVSIPSSDIPYYPPSGVPGHSGRIVLGHVAADGGQSAQLIVFQGRKHFYESGTLDPVVFPVYLAAALGVTMLIVTNAAGGINKSFRPGDLMLIKDVFNFAFIRLPGKSPNQIRDCYTPDPAVEQALRENALKAGLKLQEGTYCWLKGPSYETAAEIEMLSRLGVDAVGMSTVPELSHAASLGLRTAGLSLISNLGTGITGQKLSHNEVTETASKVKQLFSTLLRTTLVSISPQPA